MRRLTLLILLAALPASTFVNGGYVDPRLAVNRVSATEFEVIEGRGEGPRGIWCAAALYTIKTIGQTRGRLYVSEARGPAQTVQGRVGIVFSTQPVGDAASSASISVRQVGANYPIQHALQFCRDYDLNIFDY